MAQFGMEVVKGMAALSGRDVGDDFAVRTIAAAEPTLDVKCRNFADAKISHWHQTSK